VGWIDWNLLLDETGGPNHVGNLCSAPILADRATGALMHQSAHAVLGHFARFIRPGAQRVLCAATRQGLEVTAFANTDGGLATVVLNRQDDPVRFDLRVDGRSWPVDLPAHAITTCLVARRSRRPPGTSTIRESQDGSRRPISAHCESAFTLASRTGHPASA